MLIPDAPINPVDNQVSVNPDAPLDDFNNKVSSKRSGFKLQYGLALVALVAVVGGILAFTQSTLKQSQETRSDAATDPVLPKIWMSFMEDPTTASADPVGLSSKTISRTEQSQVSIWLNNPNYKEISSAAIFIAFDPAVIDGLQMIIANQSNLGTQPAQLLQKTYSYTESATNKPMKAQVLKIGADCTEVNCYPLKTMAVNTSKLRL